MEINNFQSGIEDRVLRGSEAVRRAYLNIHSIFEDNYGYNGINAVLEFFREKELVDESLPLSKQLEEIENKSHIKTRYVELDNDWYNTMVVPMLLKTKDGRYIAVIPKINGACSYIENGKSITVTKEKAKMFEDNALCFYKSIGNGVISFRSFIAFIMKSITARDALTVFIASVLAVAAGLMLPSVNGFIFARVVPSGDSSAILPAASLLFSAVSVAAVMKLLQSLIIGNTIERADIYVQSGIFSRLMLLKPGFFKKLKSGELSRMIIEFSDITKIVSVQSVSAAISMLLSLVYLFQIHSYAPQLTVFVVLLSLILVIIVSIEGRISSNWMREYSGSMSKMAGFCYEMFSGIEHIKLSGAEARVMKRWNERYSDTAQYEDQPVMLQYMPVIYKVVTVISSIVIFLLGSSLSASDYIAFSVSYGAYITAFLGAGTIVEAMSQFRSSYELIRPMLEAECEDHGASKRRLETLEGNIHISDLKFRYNDKMPYVLKGISLDINKGESVGIVGASGCGKSTLISLLLGFESPDEGIITIDGFDIAELDLKSYRSKLGAVLQNDGLINGTIYENIVIGKLNATGADVERVVEKAGLKDDIDAMPMGLSTPVSAENGTLSGGQ
ncbi:MAG: ATP-binding cassette domain-containing protein [Clostridia bacterium]|nr:ATP-binding cassette domain-containing protein [Clostridia bacterium]